MTYMLMNHRAVPDNALIQYKVTVETDPLTAGAAVLARRPRLPR